MTTTTYRNEDTGYRVTLTDNENGYAKVTDSKGYEFPMVGADYRFAALLASSRAAHNGAVLVADVPAPAPVTSPLTPDTQVPASNLAAGATLTVPTEAQARAMAIAIKWSSAQLGRGPVVRRGRRTPAPMLRAMARRGWLVLDHSIRPTAGTITPAGRYALAAYVAKHGEVL